MSDPRPGNAGRADYPRMLYHGDGRTIVAETPEAHERLMRDGWDTVPADVHMRRPATPAPAMSSGDPMGVMIRQIFNEVLDERNIGRRRH